MRFENRRAICSACYHRRIDKIPPMPNVADVKNEALEILKEMIEVKKVAGRS